VHEDVRDPQLLHLGGSPGLALAPRAQLLSQGHPANLGFDHCRHPTALGLAFTRPAQVLVSGNWKSGTSPSADPTTLACAVTSGILDAPHLRNNSFARDQVVTRIDLR
jgi:hypothetical protein